MAKNLAVKPTVKPEVSLVEQFDSGLASKTVKCWIGEKNGVAVLLIEAELDTIVQNSGRSGISKRTGEKWAQIHPLLAKIGQAFGGGMAWAGDIGIMLKVVRRGEARNAVRPESIPDWAK